LSPNERAIMRKKSLSRSAEMKIVLPVTILLMINNIPKVNRELGIEMRQRKRIFFQSGLNINKILCVNAVEVKLKCG
jgi:hypothetical protein